MLSSAGVGKQRVQAPKGYGGEFVKANGHLHSQTHLDSGVEEIFVHRYQCSRSGCVGMVRAPAADGPRPLCPVHFTGKSQGKVREPEGWGASWGGGRS